MLPSIEKIQLSQSVGPFSDATLAGNFIYTAGQVGNDRQTGQLVAGGIVAETQQTMQNLRAILQAAGADFPDVVKTTIYLTDIRQFETINEVYRQYFPNGSYPARETVQVAGLYGDCRIEISMIAYRKPLPAITGQVVYHHVGVFSDQVFSGNGLIVFAQSEEITREKMQTLTQEMRQFESIFLQRQGLHAYRAHIFTMQEELDFAGHPVLGAAATVHDLLEPDEREVHWQFELNAKTVAVSTQRTLTGYWATMNQGKATFGRQLSEEESLRFLQYLNIHSRDWNRKFPLEVVSTGLPYLIIPVEGNVFHARITIDHLEKELEKIGAKFVFVLEVPTLRGRTWDNLGLVEDIATGSSGGPAGAYLVKHGNKSADEEIIIHQGENLGRPSQVHVRVRAEHGKPGEVLVSGDVVKIAQGQLREELSQYLRGNNP